jgi:hypothetical protein
MSGLIGLQQGLSHSSNAEQIQQHKQESLAINQQYAAVELKEKDALKKRELSKTHKADDTRIRDKEKKKKREEKEKKKRDTILASTDDVNELSGHKVDIIA